MSAEARSPSPDELVARLTALKGLDVATGLRNVGGQLPMLAHVLGRFVALYRGGLPDLQLTGDGQESARWRATAHSARGACATLGMHELQHAIEAFERSMAHTGELAVLSPQAQALHEHVQRWVQGLADALSQG